MHNSQLDLLTDYPFQRLSALLGGAARPDTLTMSIGEPQHAPPAFVAEILAKKAALWGKYPPANGTAEFRKAVVDWLENRFSLPQGLVNPESHVLPVAGTREALYLIAQTVLSPYDDAYVLSPNPFYQVYVGAAVMAGAKPIYVPGANGPVSQPDYTTLPPDVLAKVKLAYLCSPGNPQGSVADWDLLERNIKLARQYGFLLAVDECYSEIYDETPPVGALQVCARLGQGLDNVMVFHSLSKRSSCPGLRSGFVAGDAKVMASFARVRSYGGAATPLPIIWAATKAWADESHVAESRALYRQKMDIAQEILGDHPGFARPEGGFFLWLNVGDGERAALDLWNKANIRVLPGKYLSKDGAGDAFIRVALVHDLATTRRALELMKPLI